MTSIYTKVAAKRLITHATKIEVVRELRNCIQVTYWCNGGRCSTFLSKKAFATDFSGIRQSGSRTLEVVQAGLSNYTVKSGNNYYVVRPEHPDTNQRCECADCNFRGAFCKHQIAVANYCGDSHKLDHELGKLISNHQWLGNRTDTIHWIKRYFADWVGAVKSGNAASKLKEYEAELDADYEDEVLTF